MHIVKRIVGVAFTLLAIGILIVGFGADSNDGASQSALDSPEASGRVLGTMIPVALFAAIGVWLLFSKK
jgi:hypothetical protein